LIAASTALIHNSRQTDYAVRWELAGRRKLNKEQINSYVMLRQIIKWGEVSVVVEGEQLKKGDRNRSGVNQIYKGLSEGKGT